MVIFASEALGEQASDVSRRKKGPAAPRLDSCRPALSYFHILPIPIDCMPEQHFVKFAQSILYRGAGISVVWSDLAIMGALGGIFLAAALSRFRGMLARQS